MWVPIGMTDVESVIIRAADRPLDGSEKPEYVDDWGCEWVYVPIAGGNMLKPGTKFLDDITKWETKVKFPDWKAMDHKTTADTFYQNRKNPDSALSIHLGTGCTERLVAILGGYEDAMVAMAEEPEAVLAFHEAFIDNLIERFDIVKALYPDVNQISINDDWGTERDTFFSEKYMEAMVYGPTKRFIDHIKASGDICFHLHTCGKIGRFMPYIVELGVDLLALQRRANDIPKLKEMYGDKTGFASMLESAGPEKELTLEDRLAQVRHTIDIYGKSGGMTLMLGSPPEEEDMWAMIMEAYCYSREFYDKERGE
jgi:hypothetical protein